MYMYLPSLLHKEGDSIFSPQICYFSHIKRTIFTSYLPSLPNNEEHSLFLPHTGYLQLQSLPHKEGDSIFLPQMFFSPIKRKFLTSHLPSLPHKDGHPPILTTHLPSLPHTEGHSLFLPHTCNCKVSSIKTETQYFYPKFVSPP